MFIPEETDKLRLIEDQNKMLVYENVLWDWVDTENQNYGSRRICVRRSNVEAGRDLGDSPAITLAKELVCSNLHESTNIFHQYYFGYYTAIQFETFRRLHGRFPLWPERFRVKFPYLNSRSKILFRKRLLVQTSLFKLLKRRKTFRRNKH